LDSPTSQTYYDISLVDGYNLDMAIIFLDTGNSTLATIPPNLTNPSCVASVGGLAAIPYSPYSSGSSGSVLGTNASFPLPFENTVSPKEVSRWCPWDLQLLPPTKPGDGVYPYPDDNIPRPIFEPCYSACSKYNRPADCCTGEYDSPAKCKPGMYSQSVKKVCPDAYSYGKLLPKSGIRLIVFPEGPELNVTLSLQHSMTRPRPSSFLRVGDLRSFSALTAVLPTSSLLQPLLSTNLPKGILMLAPQWIVRGSLFSPRAKVGWQGDAVVG